jgi:hypothetical protein
MVLAHHMQVQMVQLILVVVAAAAETCQQLLDMQAVQAS